MLTTNALYLRQQDGTMHIPYAKIIYCSASSNYSCIYLEGGKKIIITKTLKWLQANLPTDLFMRLHRSQIINADFIHEKEILNKRVCFTMKNNISFSVSRRRNKQILPKVNL
jgi:two-component system, LytTR family, response regulator